MIFMEGRKDIPRVFAAPMSRGVYARKEMSKEGE